MKETRGLNRRGSTGRSILNAFRLTAGLLLMIFMVSPCLADTTMTLTQARQVFAAANAAYRAQDYDKAAAAYRQLVDAGYDSSPVLYNLGTTDARLGSKTLALAHLSRAAKLSPRNPDIRANLDYLEKEKPTKAKGDDVSADSLWSRIYGWMTAEEWLAVEWVALLVACGGASLLLLTARPRGQMTGRWMLAVGGSVALLVMPALVAQVYKTKLVKNAVVVTNSELLSGPAPRFTRVTTLAEGQVVRKMGHVSDGYTRVRTEAGMTGYVDQSALEQL